MQNRADAMCVYEMLMKKLTPITQLGSVVPLLSMDASMGHCPKNGMASRQQVSATIKRIVHEQFTAESVSELLRQLVSEGLDFLDFAHRSHVCRLHESFRYASAFPSELIERLGMATGAARQAWVAAKQNDDFGSFAPHLESVIDILREQAVLLGGAASDGYSLYAALMARYEPGMDSYMIYDLCQTVAKRLAPFRQEILDSGPIPKSVVGKPVNTATQASLARMLMSSLGLDDRGIAFGVSAHPEMLAVAPGDVRLTSRFDEADLLKGLTAAGHETGHALFEQGLPEHLAWGRPGNEEHYIQSLGIHEGMARLWENMVCRSAGFWQFFTMYFSGLPELAELRNADGLYRSANIVRPEMVRVEADELTYQLHIALRTELEVKLLAGDLSVEDLPAAWNELSVKYFGVAPENDAQGVLQDIHWSMGAVGYFPTYLIGNLTAAQLWRKFTEANRDVNDDFARGDFRKLQAWLKLHVYGCGHTATVNGLLSHVTGEELNPDHWFAYAQEKYRGLYGLSS